MPNTNTTTAGARTQWTKPFHGVSHLGYGERCHWATIEVYPSFTTLRRWFPGCGFTPLESLHDTETEAKTRGERWVRNGVLNRI